MKKLRPASLFVSLHLDLNEFGKNSPGPGPRRLLGNFRVDKVQNKGHIACNDFKAPFIEITDFV